MINVLRGFRDILPPDSEGFAAIEAEARKVFALYGFRELRIPTLEKKELFIKSTGTTTDIVQKEMYSFTDAGGREIANRPEGTPGIARAYIENNLNQSGRNSKFFYIANMFRAERPQAGRYREFEQIGAENIGGGGPASDAETISMLVNLLENIGIKDIVVDINSLGCAECRNVYRAQLLEFLKQHSETLCEACRGRIEQNPLRALDCKIDGPRLAETAPQMQLCEACGTHFSETQELLNLAGVKFRVNHSLVRGLDYYTRTVFEVRSNAIGSQDAIAAGGRYDDLIKSMGGPNVPAVGWAMGVDRVALLLKEQFAAAEHGVKVFVVASVKEAAKQAREKAFALLSSLRKAGISADFSNFEASFKSQMRAANKSGAAWAFIIGEEELKNGTVSVKDMRNAAEQEQIKLEEAADFFTKVLD
ncbi:MAG: histidine--tRNA ligase [Elusimicrobiales bacterium]|nr:histidine--tRNA ligase [Elusimicrobiales bacterium]